MGRYRESIEFLEKGIELDNRSPRWLPYLAEARFHVGDHDAAREILDRYQDPDREGRYRGQPELEKRLQALAALLERSTVPEQKERTRQDDQ